MTAHALNIRNLQEITLSQLSRLRDTIQAMLRELQEHPEISTVHMLISYMADRGMAISMLLSWGYWWDAEIIMRCYYETFARILLIVTAPPDERHTLIDEFWTVLGDVADRRAANKAAFAEELFRNNNDSSSAAVFAKLRDPNLFSVEPTLNKAKRKLIEQKWSFSEIIRVLEEKRGLVGAKTLLHMYGLSSHLLHADQKALDLMMDRRLRGNEEFKLLESSHACRLMVDQTSLMLFCAEALAKSYGKTIPCSEDIRAAHRTIIEMSEPILALFYETQKEFYEQQ